MNEYEGTRRICYGEENACFVPVCIQCGRFIKAPKTIKFNEFTSEVNYNAKCKKCGKTQMIFEGFI